MRGFFPFTLLRVRMTIIYHTNAGSFGFAQDRIFDSLRSLRMTND